jgi:chromosome segregation ATPase
MLNFKYRGDFMVNKLKERLNELDSQLKQSNARLQQATSDIYAISGAIQEVKYWINELNKNNEVEVNLENVQHKCNG